jgi:hypothetical protein
MGAINVGGSAMQGKIDISETGVVNVRAATPVYRGAVKPDDSTIKVTDDGTISAVTAAAGDEGHVGVVKPDGSTITILTDGTISALGGGGGYAPDMDTIDLTDNDKLRLKGATGYVKTDGDQNVAGVKTFTATDVHSNGISVTGEDSRLTMAAGKGNGAAWENVKVDLTNNRSGVDPTLPGSLSVMVYNDSQNRDAGIGYSYPNITEYNNALNIKNTLGNINHVIGTKNVCSMTANGMNNVVLRQATPGDTNPATQTTELGMMFTSISNCRGFEIRTSATNIFQLFVNTGSTNTGSLKWRRTADNGVTWSAFVDILDSSNTGWL